MSTTTVAPRQRRGKRERSFREMIQVRCSLRWVGAGVGLGIASGLAIYWGGLPVAAALGAAGLSGLGYAMFVEPRLPVLERVTLRLPDLPPELDGLRIGQLTDQHLGSLHSRVNTRWSVQQMLNEQPDLLVLTGDFVNNEEAINDLADLFRPLKAPLGVYAITGNHDHWEGVEEIYEQLEPLGIEFLVNSNRCLQWRGADFWLAGIDDMWYGTPDLHAALEGIPEKAFTVLLAHEPDFAEIAAPRNIHLQLSGHTHGGHIVLPVLGPPCLPFHGLRYVSGLAYVDTMQVYVSRGLGGFPLRFNCLPEATIHTLRRG
jgi:hypothetical protein